MIKQKKTDQTESLSRTGVFVQDGYTDVKPALPGGFKGFSCMCTDA